MRAEKIYLGSVEAVKEFVQLASEYKEDVDLRSGRYQVDGKSIMGIFSLDLTSPMEVQVYGEKPEEFLAKIEQFLVKA